MNFISSQISVSEEARAYARLPYRVEFQEQECGGTPWIVASHPEFLGCLADGATREEALAQLNEVREEFIQVLLESGASIPLPLPYVQLSLGMTATQSVSIHFPVELGSFSAQRVDSLANGEAIGANDPLARPFSYREGSGVLCPT